MSRDTLLSVGKTVEQLKEERYHVWWVLTHLDLADDARAIFNSLLVQIDDQILALQKPN